MIYSIEYLIQSVAGALKSAFPGVDIHDSRELATLGTDGTVRTALDAKGNTLRGKNCAVLGMGAPKAFSLTLAAEGDVSPEIYYQNVQGAVGFNPNEEHAFLEANGSEYIV